jgi:hypothetical protein
MRKLIAPCLIAVCIVSLPGAAPGQIAGAAKLLVLKEIVEALKACDFPKGFPHVAG